MRTFFSSRPTFNLLAKPENDKSKLPVATDSAIASPKTEAPQEKKNLRPDQQIVQEFRNKMRQAEELISKLAFNLREIQGAWTGKTKKKESTSSDSMSDIIPIIGRPVDGSPEA